MGHKATPEEESVQSLLTDEVLDAYVEACRRFKTNDLVITSDAEQIAVYPRTALLEHLKTTSVPQLLIEKLSGPAEDSLVHFKGYGVSSFWFIVDLDTDDEHNDTTVCCAIAALRTEDGESS